MSLFGDILRAGGNAILGPVEGIIGKNIVSDKSTTGFGKAIIKGTTILNKAGSIVGGIASNIPGVGKIIDVARQVGQFIPPPPADVQANKAVQEAYAKAIQAQTEAEQQLATEAYYKQVATYSQTPLPPPEEPKKDNSLFKWLIGAGCFIALLITGIIVAFNRKK